MAADESVATFLDGYPSLAAIVEQLDQFLIKHHPETFGSEPTHPCLKSKKSKVIHDNLWGTVRLHGEN
jgi:hypothetical protein